MEETVVFATDYGHGGLLPLPRLKKPFLIHGLRTRGIAGGFQWRTVNRGLRTFKGKPHKKAPSEGLSRRSLEQKDNLKGQPTTLLSTNKKCATVKPRATSSLSETNRLCSRSLVCGETGPKGKCNPPYRSKLRLDCFRCTAICSFFTQFGLQHRLLAGCTNYRKVLRCR
jgi:hypothetical protein